MAVKLGKAMGLEVTVFSTSPQKEKEARQGLGADHFVVTKDPEQMKASALSRWRLMRPQHCPHLSWHMRKDTQIRLEISNLEPHRCHAALAVAQLHALAMLCCRRWQEPSMESSTQ